MWCFRILPGGVGHEAVAVVQRDAEARVGQYFLDLAVHFNQIFLGQLSSLQIRMKERSGTGRAVLGS